MENLHWLYIALGAILLLAASFAFSDMALTTNAIAQTSNEATDFQVILAIGGLVAIIVGIIKS